MDLSINVAHRWQSLETRDVDYALQGSSLYCSIWSSTTGLHLLIIVCGPIQWVRTAQDPSKGATTQVWKVAWIMLTLQEA